MRTHHKIIIICALLFVCVFISAASAADTVTNTNIYAGTNAWQYSPDEETPPDISVSGRYVYADRLDISAYQAAIGQPVSLSIHQQGAAVIQAETTGTDTGYGITYDTGGSAADNPLTVTYANAGFKQIALNTLTNPAGTYNAGLTQSVQVDVAASFTATATPPVLPSGYTGTVTLSLASPQMPPYGETYTYTWKQGDTVLISESSSYTYSWQVPQGASGGYEFTCVVKSSSGAVITSTPATVTINPVSSVTLDNINIFAAANQYDIAPDNMYDEEQVTVSKVQHVQNLYVSATGIQASNSYIGQPVIFQPQQVGSAVVVNEVSGTDLGYTLTYGDDGTGDSDNPLKATYSTSGMKTATLTTVKNPAGTQTPNVSTDFYIDAAASFTATATPSILPSGYTGTVSLSLSSVPQPPYGETYTYTWKQGNTVLISESSSYTYSWQVPQDAAGGYVFTCIVRSSSGTEITSAPVTVTANPVSSVTVTNVNVYASSNQFDVAPDGLFDAENVQTADMTHVSGRYIYAAGLTPDKASAAIAETVLFAATGQQGAAVVNNAVKGTDLGYIVSGASAATYPIETSYASAGIKTFTVSSLTNPAGSYSTAISAQVDVLAGTAGDYITDTSVTNTNIYAGTNKYQINPDDAAAPEISVSGRYLYATGFTATPQTAHTTETIVLSATGQQGAAVVNSATTGTDLGYTITYGDGGSQVGDNPLHVAYSTEGTKSISASMSNTGGGSVSGLTASVSIMGAPAVIQATASQSVIPLGYTGTVTLSLASAPEVPAGDKYTYTWKNRDTVLVENAVSYTYTWNIPKESRSTDYLLTCYITSALTGLTTASLPVTVSVAPIYDVTVTNTNVYAASNVYQAAPGYENSDDIIVTNPVSVSGRYLYASGISVNPEIIGLNSPAEIILSGQQGAVVVNNASAGTDLGYTVSYGAGGSQVGDNPLQVSYSTSGTKAISVSAQNAGGSVSGLTASVSVYGAPAQYTTTASKTTIDYGSAESITLSLSPLPVPLAGDSYTYTWYKNNEVFINNASSSSQVWTAPLDQAGTMYTFKCLVTSRLTGLSTESVPVVVSISPIGYVSLSNVNVYSASNQYDVAPYYTPRIVSISDMTHVSGRYIYASGVSASPNPAELNEDVTYTIANQQGAAVVEDTIGSKTGYLFSYETGVGGTAFVHQYTTAGTKAITAILKNLGKPSGIELATSIWVNYPTPIPNPPGGPLQPVAIPYTATLSASCIDESSVESYIWEKLDGGSYTLVASTPVYNPTITTPGNHTYRFGALSKNPGHPVTYSEPITIDAGYAPSAAITAPTDKSSYDHGEIINLAATVGGSNAEYLWSLPDSESHGTLSGSINTQSQSITSFVSYGLNAGWKSITLKVSNRYGPDAVVTIQVTNVVAHRPGATSTMMPVDAGGIYDLIDHTGPTSIENPMPDLGAMVKDLTAPVKSIIGEWFYLLIFAVPYLILFIRQRNILIPSILGVLFAAWLLVFLPGEAMRAAIGIIILAVSGGVYGLYVRRHV